MGRVKLELREIWRSGTPLRDAWLDHAPAEDRRSYRALESAPLEEGPRVAPRVNGLVALAALAANIAGPIGRHADLHALRVDLRNSVRLDLELQKLVAMGFRKGAEGISRPEVIEADFIVTAEIHWEEDRIFSHSLEFIRVAIVSADAFNEARSAISSRGRPTKNPEIDKAIAMACDIFPNFLSGNNKANCDILLELIRGIDPAGLRHGKGYSLSALNARLAHARKHFS